LDVPRGLLASLRMAGWAGNESNVMFDCQVVAKFGEELTGSFAIGPE
jgi:hypothetical protein